MSKIVERLHHKAHIETDEQYAKRVSKLHFTNDCDPDLTICELQNENKELIAENNSLYEILTMAEDPTHNPSFIAEEIRLLKKNRRYNG